MYINKRSRVAVGAAVAVVLGAGLSACGNSGHSSNNGGGGGSNSSGAVVAQAGQGARLSGTYSSEDFWNWVPDNLFPSSLTQVPGGEYKSQVVTPDNKYDISSMSCTDFLQNAGGPGFGEEAYMIDQGQNSDASQLYSYAVYEYASPQQATAMVKATVAKYQSCANFSVQAQNGVSVPVSLSLGSASETQVPAADEVADLRQSVTINGKTLVADFVYAADGNVVLVEAGTSNSGQLANMVNLDQVSQATLEAFAAGEAKAVADHQPSDYTTSTAQPTLPADRIAGDAR